MLPFVYAEAKEGLVVGSVKYYCGDVLINEKPITIVGDSKYLSFKSKSFKDRLKNSFILIFKQFL